MAYQQPAFMTSHPYGDLADVSAITDANAELTDADKRALIDFRVGDLSVFSTSAANHSIQLVTPSNNQSVDRLVIPAGHNLSGATIEVFSDVSPPTKDPAESKGSASVSDSGVFDLALTLSAQRYRLVDFQGTGQWQLSEIWLGRRFQLSAAITPDFENPYVYQQNDVEYPGGIATVELAPPRRLFSLTIRNLDPSSTDYTTLDDVLTLGRARPFWYWPTDSLDGGPYLVKLSRDGRRTQDSSVPSVRVRYRVDLEMEEVAL